MTDIAQLRPYQKKIMVKVKILEKNEPREVTSRLDDTQHSVTEAFVADNTGAILLTLWDQDIEKFELNKCYEIENGYTSLFKNSLRMNVGRFGTSKEVPDIGEINRENNLSTAKEEN